MNKHLEVLLEDIIEVIMRHEENDEVRKDIYDDLIIPMEAAGLEDFSPVLGFDPVFDQVFQDHYPEIEKEE